MRSIKLNQGLKAVVDTADYDRVMRAGPWFVSTTKRKDGTVRKCSVVRNRKSGQQKLQHFVLRMGRPVVHFKNSDHLDCRTQNLIIGTTDQNRQAARYKSTARKYTSQFKGVSWDKSKQKWKADITVNCKFIHLKRFAEETEAALAYNEAAKEYFGEFAQLNVV